MENIFIEGLQGTGKSTLLQNICEKMPEYHVCREGDYSPIELAWCTWMTGEEYGAVLEKYSGIQDEIAANTVQEGRRYIISYTRILTDIPGFHKDLERFEIYNGRKTFHDFEEIILSRYAGFSGAGYLFECSFMQNIIENLILFYQLSDEEILAFYRRLYGMIKKDEFLLLYLYSDKIEENTKAIRKQRTDGQGNELWYGLMMEYLVQSPYGKQHGCQNFDDLAAHFRHRQQVELRVIREVIRECAVILPAKEWDIEEVIHIVKSKKGQGAFCKENKSKIKGES